MHIYLIGYMGSGKTTIGEQLANHLTYSHIDTDLNIENKVNTSINNLFETKGEKFFRTLESQVLDKINNENVVVSTGGGLPCFNDNMSKILKSGISFYLYLNPKKLAERLWIERDHRPIIKKTESKEELETFIVNHLVKREPFYFRSNYIINAEQEQKYIIADILTFLNKS